MRDSFAPHADPSVCATLAVRDRGVASPLGGDRVIGSKLKHYTILDRLGAGGMGVVYRGRDERLDRDVAIKVLPPAALHDPAARKRFHHEALALSRLNHPSIETVYDFDTQDGVDFLVLEFVPGETLAARLKRGPATEREAADLGAQIAHALEEAHERGVLHRDLKPGNIVVTPKGRVKVLDFGLAKLLKRTADVTESLGLTQAGGTVGTLAYMAPEQLLGEASDARADLYSLGVMLYELLAGRRPFEAALATRLTNEILHAPVTPIRSLRAEISPRMEAVVLRCMERDPGRRYQTAREVLGELASIAAGAPSVGPEPAAGPDAPTRRITSIAVLPLENFSGNPEEEYFADGMTEELIATLAQVRALRIISRTSVMRYKRAQRPLAEIARELNVDAIVEGSVRRAGERVRITAQLLDAESERHLWARTYERDLKDVLGLQGEVAEAIVREIRVSVTPQEESRLKRPRAVNPQAYEAYLKGRFYWEKRTEESFARGLEHFEEATRHDPGYALAHVGIADTYNLLGYYTHVRPADAFPRAKASARRALEIDPACAEARASLAYAILYYDWDFAGAEREFRAAIELNRHYLIAHLWRANVLLVTKQPEEALIEFQTARSLDPLSMISNTATGWTYYYNDRYEEAVVQLRRTLDLDPTFLQAHHWLGLTYAQLGKGEEAISEFERCLKIGGRTPMAVAGLAYGNARAGRAEEARALLRELDAMALERYVSPYYRAQIHAGLGDREAGLDALYGALEDRAHWLAFIAIDPGLNPLRGTPRFDDVVRRVGLSV
jgi:serine/threonine protein kinase/Tfp pilus assembly protein PilF